MRGEARQLLNFNDQIYGRCILVYQKKKKLPYIYAFQVIIIESIVKEREEQNPRESMAIEMHLDFSFQKKNLKHFIGKKKQWSARDHAQ